MEKWNKLDLYFYYIINISDCNPKKRKINISFFLKWVGRLSGRLSGGWMPQEWPKRRRFAKRMFSKEFFCHIASNVFQRYVGPNGALTFPFILLKRHRTDATVNDIRRLKCSPLLFPVQPTNGNFITGKGVFPTSSPP